MFSTFRTILVIFLAMLQLIAPLVHAHARENIPSAGIHIPGLENLGADDNVFMSSVPKTDGSYSDVLVIVDSGIMQNHDTQFADFNDSYLLPAEFVIFNSSIPPFDTNFSPHTEPFAYQLPASSNSPRAPPAQ